MKILYISIAFPKEKEGNNLYTDLAETISKKHDITVVVTEESNKITTTALNIERGFEVLRVKTGNMFNVNLVQKAISYITMQNKLKSAIKKYLSDRRYDLIIFTAPPVTLGKVIKYVMKKYNAKSYLMQKDIFPQNAIDLGIMNKLNPVYWYFKNKEKNLYKIASKIGCMSQGNIEYLLKSNKFLNNKKLELFPNTIKISKIIENEKVKIREKYNIPKNCVIALYGGNFGKPQGMDFIIKIIESYKNDSKVCFIFSGKGTEKKKLYSYIKENEIQNVIALEFIPKQDYNNILKEADIGLIFLDYRFTIPNIPSRTLSYFEYGIPIMAATDKNTDYKELIKNSNSGMWVYSNDVEEFKNKFNYMIQNKLIREEMGRNGRKYLEENLTTDQSIKILENTYKNLMKEGN